MNSKQKAAWEATVAFLAKHGDKKYQAIAARMEAEKNQTPVKVEPLPPNFPGSRPNQGATTTGKIVSKGFRYKDKETGEDRFGSVPMQVTHYWAWDHENKKWKHIKTTHASASGR